jgi:D-3-phosphoglycerate dehydrogenase
MKILIIGELSEMVLEKLKPFGEITISLPEADRDLSAAEVIALLEKNNSEVVVVDATPLGADVLRMAPSLKMVVCTRGNPVNVDARYCSEHGIILTNTPGRNANAVAEFVLAMMINLLRNIPQALRRLDSGELCLKGDVRTAIAAGKNTQDIIWRNDKLPVIPYFEFMGSEIFGKYLGLVGLGAVGKLVAEKALALGMQVKAYDPYYKGPLLPGLELAELDDIASQADIISLHAKDTPETQGMIGKSFFKRLKPGSYLINTARGRLVDRDALLEALDSGTVAGAALDVFDYEPLCQDDPFLHHPKIICTPHIGGASRDVVLQHSIMAFESIKAYAEGAGELPNRK